MIYAINKKTGKIHIRKTRFSTFCGAQTPGFVSVPQDFNVPGGTVCWKCVAKIREPLTGNQIEHAWKDGASGCRNEYLAGQEEYEKWFERGVKSK
jgi:hypothetical protein